MAQPHRLAAFAALPRDPDRDAALVEIRQPTRTRDEIVLTASLRARLDRIGAEYRDREILAGHGLAPRSRLLFVGPPGCGKTLCAEILACDLGLPLMAARFDGIVSSYLGETASNLRRVFNYAGQHRAVLFFDEFDALGKRRDDPQEVGELKRVVSSFLQILESFNRENLVIAATNHEGLLDEALWRRFDEILHFPKPSPEQVVELLTLRLRAVRRKDVNVALLARRMKGFTFADAERVGLEATKAMLLAHRTEMTQDDLMKELGEQEGRIALAAGSRLSRRHAKR